MSHALTRIKREYDSNPNESQAPLVPGVSSSATSDVRLAATGAAEGSADMEGASEKVGTVVDTVLGATVAFKHSGSPMVAVTL